MLMPQHEHVSVVHIAPCTFISNLRKPEELKKIWLSAYPIYRTSIWLSAYPIHQYFNLDVCRSDTHPFLNLACNHEGVFQIDGFAKKMPFHLHLVQRQGSEVVNRSVISLPRPIPFYTGMSNSSTSLLTTWKSIKTNIITRLFGILVIDDSYYISTSLTSTNKYATISCRLFPPQPLKFY